MRDLYKWSSVSCSAPQEVCAKSCSFCAVIFQVFYVWDERQFARGITEYFHKLSCADVTLNLLLYLYSIICIKMTQVSLWEADFPNSSNLWTVSRPPLTATTVPLAVSSGGPPTGVAEAPPLDRWRRSGAGRPVTSQHPVYVVDGRSRWGAWTRPFHKPLKVPRQRKYL